MYWVSWLLTAIAIRSVEMTAHRFLLANTRSQWSWGYMFGYNIGALVVLFSIRMFSLESSQWSLDIVIMLLLSGGFWFLLCLFSFMADQCAEVSITSIIGQLQIVFVVIGGVVILNESISGATVVGVSLILLGNAMIITWAIRSRLISGLRKGVIFKMISVVALSAALLIDKYLCNHIEASIIVLSGYLLPAIFVLLFRPSSYKVMLEVAKATKGANIVLGCFGAISYYCLVKALRYVDISIAYPVYMIHVLLAVIMGIVFLRETVATKRKIIAVLIAIVGCIIVMR